MHGAYPEMHIYYREHHTFYILKQIVEDRNAKWVRAVLDVGKAAEFASFKMGHFAVDENLQLLFAHLIGLRPVLAVDLQDFGIGDDSLEFFKDDIVDIHFFSNLRVCFIVAIVCVSEPTVWPEFEFQKLMPELAFVAYVVSQEKIVLIKCGLTTLRSLIFAFAFLNVFPNVMFVTSISPPVALAILGSVPAPIVFPPFSLFSISLLGLALRLST